MPMIDHLLIFTQDPQHKTKAVCIPIKELGQEDTRYEKKQCRPDDIALCSENVKLFCASVNFSYVILLTHPT